MKLSIPQCFLKKIFLNCTSYWYYPHSAALLLSGCNNPGPKFSIPTHPFPLPLRQDSVVTGCNHQVKNCSVGVLATACHILHVLKANPSPPLFLWLENNSPPRAHAGGKHVLVLPNNSVTLDGSRSADDQGIVSYLWIRDGQSPAAGVSLLEVIMSQIWLLLCM